MSKKRYRRRPEESRPKPEENRQTLTDVTAAFARGTATADDIKLGQRASLNILRDSYEREDAEHREAKADTHGVDAAAR